METKQITKEDFEAYEKVRASGLVNMFMTTTVEELSGLSKEKQIAIMKGYEELNETYPKVRK